MTTVKSCHAPSIWKKMRWKSLCLLILKSITEIIKYFKSLYDFGGRCVKIEDVCMDFEPYFKVHNLVSVHPKSVILGQMTNLNMVFHIVVSVYRLVKILKLAPVPWWISERLIERNIVHLNAVAVHLGYTINKGIIHEFANVWQQLDAKRKQRWSGVNCDPRRTESVPSRCARQIEWCDLKSPFGYRRNCLLCHGIHLESIRTCTVTHSRAPIQTNVDTVTNSLLEAFS